MSDPTYREIVDLLDEALFVHDTDTGAVVDVNLRACERFGYPREVLLQKSIDDLSVPPHDAATALAWLRRAAVAGTQRVEWRCRRADGTTFLAEVAIRRGRIGEQDRLLAVVRDVTEQRRAEDALRESEEALRQSRAILEKAQEVGRMGSWVSGLGDDRSLLWSRETYRIFGVDEAEPVDVDRFFALVHPDDRAPVREAVASAVRDRRPFAVEHRVVLPDGRVRWVFERADLTTAGGTIRLVGVCQDLTERKEAEEQLRQVAKMEAVGRLAGGVAHDFNNMLTAIAGYADLALMSLSQADPLRNNLNEIKQATGRAAALTRQLLTFSRRTVAQPRVLDLNGVVREVEPMLRRLLGEDVELLLSLEEDLGRVRMGPEQLEQALMNLVVNARDAMPRGGALTIETRNVSIMEPDEHPGRHVLVSVTDTGVGMDDAVLARLFEPFFTTKERGKGTGLGLPTLYAIVQQAGGRVTVRSAPGAGATFRLYLPRVDSQAEARPAVVEAVPQPKGRGTVLVVEDDPLVRQLTTKLLTLHGYVVLAAASPDEAQERSAAHPGEIDLLLTDVVMPQLNGRALHEQLLLSRPTLGVVFMSGYADDAVVQHGVSRGEHRFVQKPFTPEALLSEVRAALPMTAALPG